jgi:phosphoribosylamine--glycine ligase
LVQYENVLIIGSGGREHSLGWKISQNPSIKNVFYAPGNGGTKKNINFSNDDFQNLKIFARKNSCLSIVGPEKPLSMGIVDSFEKDGLPIFGPKLEAAKLESSKVFAKKFMNKYNISTPNYSVFSEIKEAKEYVESTRGKVVIKVDGLASGKGVFVCNNKSQATLAIDLTLGNKGFGEASRHILVEEKLEGLEISFIVLTDGESIMPMASCQDHKNIFDNDVGPNTGGMGSYSPVPFITHELSEEIQDKIIKRTLNGLRELGISYKGFLYAGLMIEKESGQPKVLEFNARMGDPECQSLMVRMKSDLLSYVDATINRSLRSLENIEWKKQHSVCIVMASKGYPGSYAIGDQIYGLETSFEEGIYIFHSGTSINPTGKPVTNSGRVLSVTALGDDLKQAVYKGYSAVRLINWGNNGQYYRKDIGNKAIKP